MEDDLSVFITDAWLQNKGVQNRATFQGFPEFLVKGDQFGIPVEKVVRKMTGAIADRFRLKDRGYLKAGMKADITIFDRKNIKTYPDEPDRKADGIVSVYVNGRQVVKDGCGSADPCGELILRNDK